ncbi:MAG TPA: sugar ABC transporter permease [Sphaerochaeta sp.]|nr:sugar ABC transporter permease [Sphaerochaeta sp.]
MKQQTPISEKRRRAITGWLFITPQMVGFIIIVLFPLVSVFIFSMQEKNLLFGISSFAGLTNFKRLFADPLFVKSLLNTFVFSAGVVPLNLILSLLLALYLAGGGEGTRFVRSIIFLPVITSGVAWAIVWKYLLQGGSDGPINALLFFFGIQGPNWLFEKGWAMGSVIMIRVMKNLGMNVLIFMGAVLNLDQDALEAAQIDGAKRLRLFFQIKLPLLMPTVLMVSIVTIIGSMRVFDTIKLMTDGGPEGSTMVLVFYIYHQAFKMFNIGFASALAVILFGIVLLLTLLQWTARKRVSHYEI